MNETTTPDEETEQQHCKHPEGIQIGPERAYCFDCCAVCKEVIDAVPGAPVEALLKELSLMKGLFDDLSEFTSEVTALLDSAELAVVVARPQRIYLGDHRAEAVGPVVSEWICTCGPGDSSKCMKHYPTASRARDLWGALYCGDDVTEEMLAAALDVASAAGFRHRTHRAHNLIVKPAYLVI